MSNQENYLVFNDYGGQVFLFKDFTIQGWFAMTICCLSLICIRIILEVAPFLFHCSPTYAVAEGSVEDSAGLQWKMLLEPGHIIRSLLYRVSFQKCLPSKISKC